MVDSQIPNPEKMNKRRELMQDGRRYIIFYTFGENNTNNESDRKDARTLRQNDGQDQKEQK